MVHLVASGKKSTRINPYDIDMGTVVGEGSFGIVYCGVYKKKYDVAIKKVKINKIVQAHLFIYLFISSALWMRWA